VSWSDVLEQLKDGPLPHHVGVVMDGNGRWAEQRGLPRGEGHRRGAEAAERLIRLAGGEKLCAHLTLFALSTENWDRPPSEVELLLGLLEEFISRKLEELADAGVRLDVIGQQDRLPLRLRSALSKAEQRTQDNDTLHLHVALSFGGRWAVTEAVRGAVRAARAGELREEQVDEHVVHGLMPTAGIPDVDLLIRTAGEQRISNFLLWESAYAEFYFAPVPWPDFDGAEFVKALETYQGRQRSFGKGSL